MKQNLRSVKSKLLLVGIVLTLVTLACGGASPTATSAPVATEPPPQPTLEPTTVPPTEAPVQQPAGEQTYFDDFSTNVGNWEVFSAEVGSVQVTENVLLVGPFSDCGAAAGSSFGCFSQCLWCGTLVDYKIEVDAGFITGDATGTYGLVLRFQDQDSDGVVEEGDYYLGLEIGAANQYLSVVQHTSDGKWQTLYEGTEPSILVDEVNTLGAHSHDFGSTIDLFVNGTQVQTITNEPATSYGTIGLGVGFAGMQAAFDNFRITLPPPAADISGVYDLVGTNPDGSKYTGEVTIMPSEQGYSITWTVQGGSQVGDGRLADRLFPVRYSTVGSDVTGTVTFVLQEDGSLEGIWKIDFQEGTGTEVLTPK